MRTDELQIGMYLYQALADKIYFVEKIDYAHSPAQVIYFVTCSILDSTSDNWQTIPRFTTLAKHRWPDAVAHNELATLDWYFPHPQDPNITQDILPPPPKIKKVIPENARSPTCVICGGQNKAIDCGHTLLYTCTRCEP